MKDNIDNMTKNQDLIDLGVASIETKGAGSGTELHGQTTEEGISTE